MEQVQAVTTMSKFIRKQRAPVAMPLTHEDSGCLHELFETQVDLAPDSLAMICGGTTFSYRELDIRSNQLARFLRLHGAGPGKFVGLLFERSAHPIIAILACLKAGAAYVPIDPTYPSDRIKHIVTESELIILLTENTLSTRAAELYSGTIIDLDTRALRISQESSARITRKESRVSPEDLCYVIYTSGTTGRPKGVMTEHRNAFKFVLAFNEVCGTEAKDRIYQGFSLGFDGSVEEIWMAFSNGSVLVVGDKQTPRFGNELGQFLNQNGVTYFSTVPTLLSTITDPVPSLRLLVVSGEICPLELVNRWAHDELRMLNVYGPTEATVNTTAAECRPGQPITIGRPLAGYNLYVLDSEMLPVPYGEKGELYVGGETLARGYLKQPELSAERFLSVPGIGGELSARLYRTGDLVRYNQAGELEFFGRIDSQIKIRGYRVELAEIESIMLEHPRIRSASVRLFERDGLQELAAYLVIENPTVPLDRTEVLSILESRVPPYMIPGYLDVVPELPMLSSGKVDRSRLPEPVSPLIRTNGKLIEPQTELEAKIANVWARVFSVAQVSVEDDFFLNLGGHSLVAAQMVTQLRNETNKHVTVRDVYNFKTVRKLADHLASLPNQAAPSSGVQGSSSAPSSRSVFESLTRSTRLTTSTLQALSIYLLYGIGMIPFGILFLIGLFWFEDQISTTAFVEYTAALTFMTWPVLLILSIVAKWLIIGRYRPGKYPVGSFYFFRWWLANRFQALSGAGALAGTPLMPLYFRLMGAKVGRGCTIDSAHCSIWDLVSIGDDTSIGADTQVLGYRVENGMLILGKVEIGKRCFIGIHSALGLNVQMKDGGRLDDQSLLPDRQVMGLGEARRGSPAQLAEVNVPPSPSSRISTRQQGFLRIAYGLAHLILFEIMAVVLFVPAILIFLPWYYAYITGGVFLGTLALVALVPTSFIFYCFFIAALKRLVLNRVSPGVYSIYSIFYLRKWFADDLMKLSKSILLPLYTTLYLPPWLRLLGAKIGARAELSTVWYFSPELIDVGEESFFADGSIIGGKRFFRGQFEIGINRIGRRSFVGNSAILPVGSGLGDNCLLGVQSIPPANSTCTPDGTEWLGSPAFSLPQRPKVGNFDTTVTFRPTKKLYVQRAIVDALRILIPGYTALSAGVAAILALDFLLKNFGMAAMFLYSPLIGLVLSLYAVLIVVALKKFVMGTFQPVIKPLWSMYVWLNEMVNGAYESIMTPAISPFLGTPFIAPFLRMIGCKIGQHTYIDTTLFSEWDLVEIGDYACLNIGSVIQTHLFEDRIMKSSHLKIGDESTVGNMAVILYDTEMQKGSVLGPLSLLMKGETLAPFTRCHGIPNVQASEHSFEFAGVVPQGIRTEIPLVHGLLERL